MMDNIFGYVEIIRLHALPVLPNMVYTPLKQPQLRTDYEVISNYEEALPVTKLK